jgi:CRP-like cAMP-binding protein
MVDPADISGVPLFLGLPPAAITQLTAPAVYRSYDSHEVLYLAGSAPAGLLLILEGRVRVVRGRGDRQHLVHDEVSGGSLGEVPVFAGGTYPATAIAAEPTRCILLLTPNLRATAGAHPEVALRFLERLGQRTRYLVDRVDQLAAQGVNGRLARLLLRRQHAVGPGIAFTLAATQLEAAEELGTVREVLVRALRTFRQRGIIESVRRGSYRILDADRLRLIAQ